MRSERGKIFGLAIAFLFLPVFGPEEAFTQSAEEETIDENVLESVLTNSDDAAEILAPIDLNDASEDDLLSIPEMTSQCASSIVAYKRRSGSIRNVEEIAHLEGMTPELISVLKRRVVILRDDALHANAESYFSLSPQKMSLYDHAYREHGILNFQRFAFAYRDFEVYAVTDKDAGERSYLDFYSLAVSAKRILGFSTINVGDYALSLGNGLLFSSGGMISKSAGAVTPLFTTRAYSLRPYRSKGENKFLRGAALALPAGAFEITTFASSKYLAARADSTGSVTSIDYSGLTLAGSVPRDKLRERIAGGIIHFDSPTICGGVSAVYFAYDHPFTNYYRREVLALESFARVRLDKLAFSGEALFDRLISFNTSFSLDYGEAQFALGIRNLRSRIIQNYSGPLSESFPSNQEQGIYFGATLRPAQILKMGFYYDRFRIISTSGEPERNGEEIFVDSYLSLSRKKIFEGSATVLYLRYKYKTKEDSYISISDFPAALTVIAGSRQSFRIDFRHKFTPAFSVRARMERNFVSSGEKGELILFDSGWRFKKGHVDTRICFYRTDSYKSAFYTVEKDLPHVSEFTLFYGDGARFFILGGWNPNGPFSFGIKMSRDIYGRDREIAAGSVSQIVPGTTEVSLEFSYSLN